MRLGARRTLLRSPAVVASGFTPANLSGLFIWLDASVDASVIRSGADVSAWNDQSGAGNNFTGNNNPQYSATGFPGSKPGISLTSGSSHSFNRTSVSLNSAALSVFMVMTQSNPNGNAGFICCAPTSGGNDFNSVGGFAFTSTATGSGSNGQRVTRGGGAPSYDGFPTSPAINTAAVYGFICDGAGNITQYPNFSSASSAACVTNAFGNTAANIAIGARQAPGVAATYMTGTIAEVVMCASALDGTARANLQAYFAAKWGTP